MSFALEFRKKYLLEADRLDPGRQFPSREETKASRASALGAFLVAAAILTAFDSAGLRSAAQDIAETGTGDSLLSLTEAWDGAMERAGAKSLVANVRDAVSAARDASWEDVAGLVEAPVVAIRNERDRDLAADHTYTGALPASAGAVPTAGRRAKGL